MQIVLVPLIYVFAGISPLKTQNLWEFCFAFIPYFAMTSEFIQGTCVPKLHF
jgi:hypothetical protein